MFDKSLLFLRGGGGVVKSKNSQIPVSIIKQITMLISPFKIDFKVAARLSSN